MCVICVSLQSTDIARVYIIQRFTSLPSFPLREQNDAIYELYVFYQDSLLKAIAATEKCACCDIPLKTNCSEIFDLLKTLFLYSLTKKTPYSLTKKRNSTTIPSESEKRKCQCVNISALVKESQVV